MNKFYCCNEHKPHDKIFECRWLVLEGERFVRCGNLMHESCIEKYGKCHKHTLLEDESLIEYQDKNAITAEEHRLILSNKPIAAIKSIRKRTGMNLRDCKELIDAFRN